MRITRKMPVLAMVVGATLLVAGCAAAGTEPTAEPTTSGDPIIVGTLLPATGPNGPGGVRMLAGIQIAIDELNASGGVLGRPLEVVSKDDEGTPAVAVSRAQELVSENVDVVFGGLTSTVALAAQPIFARSEITDITITASADAVLSGEVNPDAVRLNSTSAASGDAIASYINDGKYKKIVILQQNDAYGESQTAALVAALDTAPIDTILFDSKATDFRVEMDKVKADNPDLVAVINAAADTGGPAMVQQLRAAGIDVPFTMAPTTFAQSVIDLAGDAANGGVSAQAYLADKEPFASNDGTKRLVAAYAKVANGDLPNHEVAFGYTAVKVWAAAANDAGSLARADIAGAIKGHDFSDTPFGDVSFDKTGQMSSTLQLYKVEDGKIETF